MVVIPNNLRSPESPSSKYQKTKRLVTWPGLSVTSDYTRAVSAHMKASGCVFHKKKWNGLESWKLEVMENFGGGLVEN